MSKHSAPRRLRVLVVGGLDRLATEYERSDALVDVDAVSQDGPQLRDRILAADGVVVVPRLASHSALDKVRKISRIRGTPVVRAATGGRAEVRRSIEALVAQIAQSSANAHA